MQTFYTIILVLAVLVALLFALLVFFTGKGDAMSGGSSVRTSFKGKASFEDIMSRFTLFLGIGFMVLMLGLDVMGNYLHDTRDRGNTPTTTAPDTSGTTGSGTTGGTTGSTPSGTTGSGTTGSGTTTGGTTGGTTGTTPSGTTGGTTGTAPATTSTTGGSTSTTG